MTLALIILGATGVLELLLWTSFFWRIRKLLATILIAMIAFSSSLLVASSFKVWAVLVAVISLYRVISLGRIVAGRIHPDYLYHATLRTALVLIGLQTMVLALTSIITQLSIDLLTWWVVLAAVQLMAATVLLTSTTRHLRTIKPSLVAQSQSDSALPTLTVCIPARNETEDLQQCLTTLLKSNYPKLEILVLDDCSQNKRTPEIIKDFAHDGVRFIAGKTPPEQWLAKNYAYQQLHKQASGEVLLFCGVDVRFEPDTLKLMVLQMLHKKKSMLSMLPQNVPNETLGLMSKLIQPCRYAWELALPRRMLNRPPVLSTCWVINSEALRAVGGFSAVSRKAVPESFLARQLALLNDSYSFLQSDDSIVVTSQKSVSEQRSTAVRTRYPQLHRRPEFVLIVGFTEFTVLVLPLILLLVSISMGAVLLAGLSAASFVLATIMYVRISSLTYRKLDATSFWLLVPAALYDIGLLNYSMWQYEFNKVIWKDRNVCLPVMWVTSSLE